MITKTALITGASRGIGAQSALMLASEGYKVYVNYCKCAEKAEELASKIDGVAVQCDVADKAQVMDMTRKIIADTGKIDVLVNNAGISVCGLFTDISDEDEKRIFDVNVMGTLNTTKAVLPYMIKRKYGKIINISSMWGQVGASCEVHYSATKSAIIGFTKALSKEVGPSGIQVNCIAPGVIRTEMNGHLSDDDLSEICEETPLGRIGEPYDIAEMVCFLASNKADFITGQVFGVNGGIVI